MVSAQDRRRRLRALPRGGAPLTRRPGTLLLETSQCPPSFHARIMQLGSLVGSPGILAQSIHRDSTTTCLGRLGPLRAKFLPLRPRHPPLPRAQVWGQPSCRDKRPYYGEGMDGGEIHTTPYPSLPRLSTAQSRPIIPIELHHCGPPYGGVRQDPASCFYLTWRASRPSRLPRPLSQSINNPASNHYSSPAIPESRLPLQCL
jgi:hypothetical protein